MGTYVMISLASLPNIFIKKYDIIKNSVAKSSLAFEARVTLRFMRKGRKHEPFYRVIAVDSRKRRDTEPLEFLGWYNPKTKEANLNAPAIKNWLSVGAQPSKTVTSLLKRAAILKVVE